MQPSTFWVIFGMVLLIFWNSVQSFSLSSVSKITVRCQDSSYLNGSSRLRLGKEPVKIYNQILIIFVTSCYVLNKIVILSEISIPEWSGTIPGQEITPRSRNWESDRPKTIQNWENDTIEKKAENFIIHHIFDLDNTFSTKRSKMNKKDDFWGVFGDVRDFCTFKKYIDSRNPNYNEKSTILDRSRVQPKERDVALRVARLICSWFFSRP